MKSDYPLILRFHNVTLGRAVLCLTVLSMNVDYFVTFVRNHGNQCSPR
jgi:hypothetical protein